MDFKPVCNTRCIMHLLCCNGIIFEKFSEPLMKWAGNFFITGIILFSGSLYLLTILKIQESSAVKIAGPITPIGGIFFIAGWLLSVSQVLLRKK